MMTENLQSKHLFSNHEPENTHVLDRYPDEYNMDYQSIYLQTPDGEFIHAYWIHQPETVKDSDTLLYLHGAGGNISHRLEVIRLFYENLQCNILIIDYRGQCHYTSRSFIFFSPPIGREASVIDIDQHSVSAVRCISLSRRSSP
jgi:predicted alpha/beta-fold hydrolase